MNGPISQQCLTWRKYDRKLIHSKKSQTNHVCFSNEAHKPTHTARLTTSYCASSCEWSITNMQNVRNADRWCTTQIGGAQHSPVLLRLCTT